MARSPVRDPPAPPRPLRADAARNRARVLDAARDAFAEAGLDVGVEEIARRAGVGKGTLYRRFPTKGALVRAIFEGGLAELERAAEEARRAADPWEGFCGFLGEAARMQAANQGFLDMVAQRMGPGVLTGEGRRRLLGILAEPLRRGQQSGAVRGDLDAEDLLMLLRMVGSTTRPTPTGRSPEERWQRYLALLLDALRPGAASPLP
jgi:AcrR family transcriptional regulator